MADLRKTMDDILRKYGVNVLLKKADPGTGSQWQIHTVRSMIPGSSGLANVQQEGIPGRMYDVDKVYYFRHTAKPEIADEILEPYGRGMFDIQHFLIEWAEPMKGWGGRIEFWTVGVTRRRKTHSVND